ncbi:hypothetical protein STEG23_022998 [Scotinomys teguina]
MECNLLLYKCQKLQIIRKCVKKLKDEASAGSFDVKALGMIHSHSSAIPEPLEAPDCKDICSPKKEGTGLGFEVLELDCEKKSLGFVVVLRS